MKKLLRIERTGHVATVTICRPHARNALRFSGDGAEFLAMADALNADQDVRCVILTGEGSAFCAGGDLGDIQKMATDPTCGVEDILDRYENGIHAIVHAIWGLRAPLIAAVNGAAIGLGNDLACLADIRIAARSARFGATFLRWGLIPGDGGSWLLPRIIGYERSAELLFTATTIDAETALNWGLVSRLVPEDDLMPGAMALAEQIARQPAMVLRATKELMRASATQDFEAIMAASASRQAIFHKSSEHSQRIAPRNGHRAVKENGAS